VFDLMKEVALVREMRLSDPVSGRQASKDNCIHRPRFPVAFRQSASSASSATAGGLKPFAVSDDHNEQIEKLRTGLREEEGRERQVVYRAVVDGKSLTVIHLLCHGDIRLHLIKKFGVDRVGEVARLDREAKL
jgi:hypothetical protein